MIATFKPYGKTTAVSLFPVIKYNIDPPEKYQYSGRLDGNPLFYVLPINTKIYITSLWSYKYLVGSDYIWVYFMDSPHYGELIIDDITYTKVLVVYTPKIASTPMGRVCEMAMAFEIVSG